MSTTVEQGLLPAKPIPTTSRIYIPGHTGLVGSAILRRLQSEGYSHLLLRTHQELDLTSSERVAQFFREEKPEYVILCAARVGTILANTTHPAEFLYENTSIQTSIIHESWKNGVKRLFALGSSSVYPRECPQPIGEEHYLTGSLEPSNRAYAVSKITAIEMCWSYNKQYGTRYLCLIPPNLYGPGDNFDVDTSHVLPALIKKFHQAKIDGDPSVALWGTGDARREFLYSDDLADVLLFLMDLPDEKLDELLGGKEHPPVLNVGSGTDLTIGDLALIIQEIVGYDGEIEWDTTKPEGIPRKLLDVGRINEMGWIYQTELSEGILRMYEHFLSCVESGKISV